MTSLLDGSLGSSPSYPVVTELKIRRLKCVKKSHVVRIYKTHDKCTQSYIILYEYNKIRNLHNNLNYLFQVN